MKNYNTEFIDTIFQTPQYTKHDSLPTEHSFYDHYAIQKDSYKNSQ